MLCEHKFLLFSSIPDGRSSGAWGRALDRRPLSCTTCFPSIYHPGMNKQFSQKSNTYIYSNAGSLCRLFIATGNCFRFCAQITRSTRTLARFVGKCLHSGHCYGKEVWGGTAWAPAQTEVHSTNISSFAYRSLFAKCRLKTHYRALRLAQSQPPIKSLAGWKKPLAGKR